MRKFYIGLIGLLFVLGGCASATEITKSLTNSKTKEDVSAIMADEDITQAEGAILNSGLVVEVKDDGDRILLVITNPVLTQKGSTDAKDLKVAVRVKLASGILDAAGKKPYFAIEQVKNGKVQFSLPNFAKAIKAPVVEHIWGYAEAADGSVGYLVLDPKDSWVCYKEKVMGGPDLETLAIGLVMYPDKATYPLKGLGKGKLIQGRHPELAEVQKEK